MLKTYFLSLLTFLSVTAFAQSSADLVPDRPSPERLVNNLSKEMPDYLSSGEEDQLESKLENFSKQTSNQIAIVIVDDLNGLEPWDYATRLHQKWGIGQAKEDNGIVILIKPTGGRGERKVHISVGYGLEGAIPDATANRISDEQLIPGLANGEVYKTLDETTDILMGMAKGEYNSDKYSGKEKFPKRWIIPLIFLILFIILRSRRGGGGGGGISMGSALFFGGGGFGGGSSGGGFGGFGGGGAGGGGAGGSW
ncbi:MAG: TPM domain-containing protein [Bacteroidia bacterium]